MSKARDLLTNLGTTIHDRFAKNRRVMSFGEYLELVSNNPRRHLRSAPQYLVDCFEHYGSREVQYPWGRVRRFNLFDCPWADGRERLIGHEDVQNQVYRALYTFVNEGTANKLVLLHGPNGSAKSTLVRCIGRGMQDYSRHADGALYRFNWIFPTQKSSKGDIGFAGAKYDATSHGDTFAYLPDELIDAKLPDELRDHPMLLIPATERRKVIAEFFEGTDDAFVLADYLNYGRLSHKNRAIFESLLTTYQGDYARVLRHVQVERFYIQHRYREGYVTVEPQLSVDASERQVTADRSISALPTALQSVSLYEYGGHIVNANRGLIEYSDLLKRPLEAYKYLLSTVERASVSLQNATLFLDLVFLGSSNEIHLSAFKEIPEFQSFKGRLSLIRVPYLLDFVQEEEIYAQKIREAATDRDVAPHCAYVAALWAVLTRMRKPQADRYPNAVSDLIARLTPLEKAELYALGKAPDALTENQAKELKSHLEALWTESDTYPNFEGRSGASPRELLAVVFNAANSTKCSYVSPLVILDEIGELVKQVSVYDFLKQEALPGGFHDHGKFIDLVRERLIDRLDDEVRASMGLVEEGEYGRVFDRYVTQVMHWTKKEKVVNPTTGRSEDPDENLMREVETTLEVGTPSDDFRHDLISKIGAWSLDHANERPDYRQIFVSHFKRLHQSYFEQQRKPIQRGVQDLAALLNGADKGLSGEALARSNTTLAALIERFGYTRDSARDFITLLARTRYAK